MEDPGQELPATLQTFVRDELLAGSREVGLDDELLMDGYVDSVGVMRLTAFIEESFGLKVPPQDLTIENFRSVNSLSAYLQRQLSS